MNFDKTLLLDQFEFWSLDFSFPKINIDFWIEKLIASNLLLWESILKEIHQNFGKPQITDAISTTVDVTFSWVRSQTEL